MIISMQGNWHVAVKSKSAAFPQRFIVQGASTGNGIHSGTPGTSVHVTGSQWSIAIQSDPGTGWQSSATKLKFPHKTLGNYEFDILSDDGGGSDTDFNDLILTCSAPANINDFILYGNVTLYGGTCIFNPCRRFPYVIDTYPGLVKALRNPLLSDWIKKHYADRIPPFKVKPNPPDPPPYFKPIVFDLSSEAMQPKTSLAYVRKAGMPNTAEAKGVHESASSLAATEFTMLRSAQVKSTAQAAALSADKIELLQNIDRLFAPCFTDAGSNLTLTFEEYDRTAGELSGGAYTGTGNRRLLGDTVTDMNGNYIFRFTFDMSFPGLEDASDITTGEDVNVVMYPDVIVKIVEYSPFRVRYESAPYYNIPNLKRIDLCLPESTVQVSSACFNGNLIGSLGNVFLGGNQNTSASLLDPDLARYNYSNYLEPSGKISVGSTLAGFTVECAAWGGTIDMRGCMFDAAIKKSDNKIKWYTIRVNRAGTSGWDYVTQNYKHPKFSKRNLPNYIGDDVGPFYPNVGGALNGDVPSYINIQSEIFINSVDWEFSNFDRYMQLNTALYDVIAGVRTPGRFFVRVDGYDAAGVYVPGATDLIALFIQNNGLQFQLTAPGFTDPLIVDAGCGLYRLTDAQMKTPLTFSFEASDPDGFVDSYSLTMYRCPGTSIDLNSNMEANFTIPAGSHTFPEGSSPSNTHHLCPGFKGTQDTHSTAGLFTVVIQPTAAGDGWIKPGEYFTIYSLTLTAAERVTNGYNAGIYGPYYSSVQILMERLNP